MSRYFRWLREFFGVPEKTRCPECHMMIRWDEMHARCVTKRRCREEEQHEREKLAKEIVDEMERR